MIATEKILITGANGSIGQALGLDGIQTDLEDLDVTKDDGIQAIFEHKPTLIIHLAAVKDAPQGEETPEDCLRVNALGTQMVVEAAKKIGARVITTSTCKAANPETCYGASKLLAERITLNAGGTVVRFYNVIESSGNVFEYWASLPSYAAIPYTPCTRFFITRDQAVSLLRQSIDLPSGRYAADPGHRRLMRDVAGELYPDRELVAIPVRRGDRLREPLCGDHEYVREIYGLPGILKITSPHD